jgi:hypothetical protein
MCFSLLLSLFVTGAQASPSFEARIEQVHAREGGVSLLLVADLAGYGDDTKVATGTPAVLDEDGFPIPVRDLAPGQRVRVDFDGGFMESYPLQVHARRITRLAKAKRPTISGFVVEVDRRQDGLMLWTASQPGGRPDLIIRVGSQVPLEGPGGQPVSEEELAEGMKVTATFDGRILESMPPQVVAEKLVVGEQSRPKPRPQVTPKPQPTMDGYQVNFEDRGMIWMSSSLDGTPDIIFRFDDSTRFERADGSPATKQEVRRASKLQGVYDGKILESMPPQIECSVIRILL